MLALILKYYQMHFKILELWFQCNFQSYVHTHLCADLYNACQCESHLWQTLAGKTGTFLL